MDKQIPTLIDQRLHPPLKWAGGKRWLAPLLKDIWMQSGALRLVEPFCGGLSVALNLAPGQALLNDINPHTIHFYRWLQKGLKITIPLKNTKEYYYASREHFNTLISEKKIHHKKSASLFYYLNKTGYNGLCRFNQSGFFNVPFGSRKHINYRSDFSEYKDTLGQWQFNNQDYLNIRQRAHDFIYADPPYDVPFTEYSPNGFSWRQQQELVDWLCQHKGPVVLSNEATPRILKLYKAAGFKLFYLRAPRMISCNGDRTPAKEVLAVKNLLHKQIQSMPRLKALRYNL